MNLKLEKKYIIDFFTTLSVLFVILTTGSDYLANRHMAQTMFVFLAVSIVLLHLKKWKLNLRITVLASLLLIAQFVNAVFTTSNGFATNDAIITIMRFVCIIIIASSLSIDIFKRKYIQIVYYISIISLVCFSLLMFGVKTLPFQEEFARVGDTSVYCTFYYTIGWGGFSGRNSGLFWEPGVFQIILNIAIFFMLSNDNFRLDKYFFVNIITLLTTMSTTGFICLLINMIYFIYRSQKFNHKWKYYFLIFVCIIIVIFIDANTSIISDKLVNRGGSFSTRSLDTVNGYLLTLMHPFVGFGSFNTVVSDVLLNYGVRNISNGLAGFILYNGYPFTILYLLFTFLSLYKICERKIISSLLIFVMFFLFYNTEYIMPLSLFWFFCFIFLMKNNSVQKDGNL